MYRLHNLHISNNILDYDLILVSSFSSYSKICQSVQHTKEMNMDDYRRKLFLRTMMIKFSDSDYTADKNNIPHTHSLKYIINCDFPLSIEQIYN
jgi:hypothetical protein